MQKVSLQKGVPTEIKMKTFFAHKTWNCDLIFLQFGQFGIISVATWWYLLWLVSHKSLLTARILNQLFSHGASKTHK